MKSRLKFLVPVFIIFLLSVTGCSSGGGGGGGDGDDDPDTYTVTFDAQGGDAVPEQEVEEGEKATEPAAPAKSFYTLDGWYTEAECTTEWDFSSDEVTEDITLYAKWTHNDWEDFAVTPLIYDTGDGSLDVAGNIFDLQGTANGDVYVVGEFEKFKGQTIRSVAKLSGSTWSQVGTDLDANSIVHSICITLSGDIYIGGLFGHVAVFGQPAADGPKAFAKLISGTWDNITEATANSDFYYASPNAQVNDIICDSNGKIYVVGMFQYAGAIDPGHVRNSFAILDSGAWTGFDNTGFEKDSSYSHVREIFFDEAGTHLYVIGDFNNISGTPAFSGYWAYWDGSAWGALSADWGAKHPVRFKTDGSCYKKAIASESEGYFAGVSNDGTTYTSDTGFVYTLGSPKCISVFGPDGTPYKYGIFRYIKWTSNATGSPVEHTLTANCIVKWNGTEWVAFGNLPTSTVKQVSRVFFTPNGDMWITTRNDTQEYAFGPNYGTNLYRIKK